MRSSFRSGSKIQEFNTISLLLIKVNYKNLKICVENAVKETKIPQRKLSIYIKVHHKSKIVVGKMN